MSPIRIKEEYRDIGDKWLSFGKDSVISLANVRHYNDGREMIVTPRFVPSPLTIRPGETRLLHFHSGTETRARVDCSEDDEEATVVFSREKRRDDGPEGHSASSRCEITLEKVDESGKIKKLSSPWRRPRRPVIINKGETLFVNREILPSRAKKTGQAEFRTVISHK